MENDHKETTTKEERGLFVDWDKKKKEEAKQLVTSITDWLNKSNHSTKDFFATMDREHRYLQGEFAELCVEYLLHCTKPDFEYDPRNAHAALYGTLLEYAIEHRNEIAPQNFDYSVRG